MEDCFTVYVQRTFQVDVFGLFNISSLNCYHFKLAQGFSAQARVFSLFRNVQNGSAAPEGVPWSPPRPRSKHGRV